MAGGPPHAANRQQNTASVGGECPPIYAHSEALMNGLNSLRCADKLFDVTLIAEGKTFKAHRVVLAACSDYFCAMFTDEMIEANQSEIKLNGVSARGIQALIEYAYTAQLKLDRNNVEDVLSVSTHTQMKPVVDACSNFLEAQIDLENCIAISTLADLYSLETLKRKTYRYICSRFDEFAKTPDLVQLSCDQLEQLLSCNYPVDCSEERILQITIEYCKKANVKPEQARRLFARVHFNQIHEDTLNALISRAVDTVTITNSINDVDDSEEQVDEEEVEGVRTCPKIFREIMQNLKHEQEKARAKMQQTILDSEEVISADVLTNARGMEMALVKIGGFETNGLTNEISCYLPSKGKWAILTVIPHIDQCNYGTAVLGNELYIVGGSYDVCLKEYIHPFGFRYCPSKNKWKTIAPIQADRCRFSLNALGNNYLYAVGGVCELEHVDVADFANDLGITNCERYNVNADRWEYFPMLPENRSQHAGVVIDDKLYISGGLDRHLVLQTLWCFDTKTETWNKLCPMPVPRADHVLIAFDNRIYACGGWYEDPLTETRILIEAIDVYDVNTDTWMTESYNPMPKYYTGVAAMKRRIYFVGGLLSTSTINRATSAVQCYDLDTKEWTYDSEWEYPKEVWECTCATFYVPREHDESFKLFWKLENSSKNHQSADD